jgi:flavin-dependent dehydrogenase
MVYRKKFDYGLVKIAQENGSEFLDGKKIKDVQVFQDKVTVNLHDQTKISSDVLIGADGVNSIIAKSVDLTPRQKKVNVCVFQEYKLNEQILNDLATDKRLSHVHLMYKNIPGYAWFFTKKDSINIGIGQLIPYQKYVKQKNNLISAFKSYFNFIKQQKLIPNDLKIGKLKGGCIPIKSLKQTYSDRVIICGDAAGFINPISGGGIQFAMISGENAAMVFDDAFKNDNFKSSFLSKYQKLWMNEFGKDFQTLLRFSKIYFIQAENFIKIASKDKKLSGIMLDYLYGNTHLHENRKRLLYYYILDRLKDTFGLI